MAGMSTADRLMTEEEIRTVGRGWGERNTLRTKEGGPLEAMLHDTLVLRGAGGGTRTLMGFRSSSRSRRLQNEKLSRRQGKTALQIAP